MHVHTLAAFSPPKAILHKVEVESVLTSFFWGTSEFGPKHHWVKWKEVFGLIEEGKLADLITPATSFLHITVRDVALNVNNCANSCFVVLSPSLLNSVKGRLGFILVENDRPVWTANSDGRFSLGSAWEICRFKRNTLFSNAQIKCGAGISQSSGLLSLGKLLTVILPFDEVLQRKGFQLAF